MIADMCRRFLRKGTFLTLPICEQPREGPPLIRLRTKDTVDFKR